MSNVQETVQSTGKRISMTDIIRLLKVEGKTRKEINAIYGETDAAMKLKVWSHPDLKNIKTVKIPNIELVDDRNVEAASQVEAPAIAEEVGNISTEEDVVIPVSAPVEENVTNGEAEQVEAPQEAVAETAQIQDAPSRGTW